MTAKKNSSLVLDSDKARLAATAVADVDRLEAQLDSYRSAALRGELDAATFAAHRERLELARLRADAAESEAQAERDSISSNDAITAAVSEFLEDPALTASPLLEALQKVRAALDEAHAANTARNSAVQGWVKRLRELGIPDEGLTVGDDEIRIQSSAVGGTSIRVGNARVTAVSTVNDYLAHITYPDVRKARQRIDPANLSRIDQRGSKRTELVRVRLLRATGGHVEGTELTSKTHSPSVLARLVRDSAAEHLEGPLPEVPEVQHTLFGVDHRPIDPDREQARHDKPVVDRAVRNAFEH